MIGAVVLAAGSSTRMGTQKLLLPYNGRPLIRHVVECVLLGAVEKVVVVTGHSKSEVEACLEGLAVDFAHNAQWSQGMLSSVRAGISSLDEGLAAMVVLGDQPCLPEALLKRLIGCLRSAPEKIVVPVSEGRRGHPILFGARYRMEVMSKFDDVGLRGLLKEHVNDVLEVEAETTGILADLDTPEDYQAALKALEKTLRT